MAGTNLNGKSAGGKARATPSLTGRAAGERSIDQEKLTNWYNFQARFYHFWRDDYGSPLLEKVIALLELGEGPTAILDAGCGTGMFAIGLARVKPQWRLEGLDAAEGMLAIAEKQARRMKLANVKFRPGDVAALPYDDACFDGIVAAGLFPNLNDAGVALGELFRVLRPGGRLVVVEMNRQSMSWATKTVFRAMIFGYKLFSTFVSRFRFAKRWNITASTIDPRILIEAARQTGFRGATSEHHGNYLLLRCERGDR